MPHPVRDVRRSAPAVRAVLLCFGAVSVVHVVLVGVDADPWRSVTKVLLMPLLALWVHRAGGPRLVVAALLLSAVGDAALEVERLFALGMAGFAAAHVCYVVALRRAGALARLRPAPVAAYVVLWAALVATLWPGLGGLAVPIAVYSALLTATAVLATGLGRWTGTGGALFLLSDTLIALGLADRWQPEPAGVWIMTTYLAAQMLLATGITAGSARTGATRQL